MIVNIMRFKFPRSLQWEDLDVDTTHTAGALSEYISPIKHTLFRGKPGSVMMGQMLNSVFCC